MFGLLALKLPPAIAVRRAGPLPDRDTGWATAAEAAGELDLSRVRVISLCRQGKIVGAQRVERPDRRGTRWLIPRPVRRV